jgi:hypothetical protein
MHSDFPKADYKSPHRLGRDPAKQQKKNFFLKEDVISSITQTSPK